VWLLAVGAADWGVRVGVSGFAVANRTGVFAGGVVLAADSTDVAVVGAALCGVPILLALVALGGGTEGYIFDEVAFTVEQVEAGGTERLLGHFTDEGNGHG